MPLEEGATFELDFPQPTYTAAAKMNMQKLAALPFAFIMISFGTNVREEGGPNSRSIAGSSIYPQGGGSIHRMPKRFRVMSDLPYSTRYGDSASSD